MVRGSTIRVTGLNRKGQIPADQPVQFVASRSVVKVSLTEVTESGSNEVLRSDIDRPRVSLKTEEEVLGYGVDVDLLRVDPGLLYLMAGVPLATNAAGDVVGFDSKTKVPAASFGLEVWSKLIGEACADGQRWGYTLMPWLAGGYLSGFAFEKNVVSFNLRGARTQRGSDWCVGPYDFTGWHERLLDPVSGNDSLRTQVMVAPPPAEQCGITAFEDCISNGDVDEPHPLAAGILAGGSAETTSPWVVHGGRA